MSGIENSTFKKIDLHIHTPKSLCYSDRSVSPEQIVDAALAAELDAIAITDHNTVEAIDDIGRIASQKGLCVFPGIELTTEGGHVIGIFEMDTPREKLENFLVSVGVPYEEWGDAAAMTDSVIEEVFQEIHGRNGIAIAAHIERWPSGFLETNQPRQVKMNIHNSEYLDALEISVADNKYLWNSGQVRGYPKKYACIQGSDAHALDEIGRRPVYVQMTQVNLEDLRRAFLEYESRIMFPNEFSTGK